MSEFRLDENEPLTKKRILEWLRKARLNELNIFYDRNKIIIILCEALLEHFDKKEKK